MTIGEKLYAAVDNENNVLTDVGGLYIIGTELKSVQERVLALVDSGYFERVGIDFDSISTPEISISKVGIAESLPVEKKALETLTGAYQERSNDSTMIDSPGPGPTALRGSVR